MNSQPPTAPTPLPPPRKKWPWVLGCGCLTFIFLTIIGIGVGIYKNREWFEKNFATTQTTTTTSPAPTQQNGTAPESPAPDSNTTETPASEPSAADSAPDIAVRNAPAGWKTYNSAKAPIAKDLQEHLVPFSFSYPPTFVPTAPQEGLYIVLRKYGANGKDVAESFSVSWYETSDPNGHREDDTILKDLSKQWASLYPEFKCHDLQPFALKVGDSLGYGMTWEFRMPNKGSAFVSGAKSILAHPRGQGRGVRIDQYGTWLESRVKSANDVGNGDDLGAILATFQFGAGAGSASNSSPEKAENAATAPPGERLRVRDSGGKRP